MNLKGRSFLTLLDFTPEEIGYLLDLAAEYKAKKKARILHKDHEGKNIVILFAKDSTRTRCAFEVAGPLLVAESRFTPRSLSGEPASPLGASGHRPNPLPPRLPRAPP